MTKDIKLPPAPWLGYDPERGDLHGFKSPKQRQTAVAEYKATLKVVEEQDEGLA